MEMQKYFNKSFNNNKEKLTKKKMSLYVALMKIHMNLNEFFFLICNIF